MSSSPCPAKSTCTPLPGCRASWPALNTDHAVRLVVDMSGVDFCDSTGMNVLLAAQRLAREHGGNIELSGPRPAVRKILQVTGLESVFTVVEDGGGRFRPVVLAGPA